jgi:hypothetical protein
MRSVLADKLDLAGPSDRFDTADAYQQAIQGLSQMKTDIVIHKTFVDGPDVVTWYDLHPRIARLPPWLSGATLRRQDHDGACGLRRTTLCRGGAEPGGGQQRIGLRRGPPARSYAPGTGDSGQKHDMTVVTRRGSEPALSWRCSRCATDSRGIPETST